jgi:hypothetical protein
MVYHTIKRVQKIVFKRFQQIPTPLGRWHRTECPKKIDIKVDWSNEDHCGPCGEKALKTIYEMEKSDNNNNKTKKEV